MDNFLIWNTVSMAWTEIGLNDKDYPVIAAKLKQDYGNWEEIREVAFKDVCGSFAISSLSILLVFIPLIGFFLVTPMPDWGYDEKYLREKMQSWQSKPRWVHYINPFRALGYPIALLFAIRVIMKLKAAYKDVS